MYQVNRSFFPFFSGGHTFLFGCSHYTFHVAPKYGPVSWEDSRRLCKKIGSDLVSIESVEEWNFLKKLFIPWKPLNISLA